MIEWWREVFSAIVVAYVGQWLVSQYASSTLTQSRASKSEKRRSEGKKTVSEMAENLRLVPSKMMATWTLGPIVEVAERARESKENATQLLHDVAARSVKSDRHLNCITEFVAPLPELVATSEANYKRGRKPGMLQGLPVSIKECVGMKGTDATVGTARRIGILRDDDAALVKVLREQGAVPYARTNIPQTMLSFECSNPVFGQTCNPYDQSRGPGGSSGGEGALIGSNGSILGIGSDIGGSLRIPATFSGCCGFKPTAGRVSTIGMESPTKGQESIKSTAGPMAREVDGLVLLMRALLADGLMHKLDPTVPSLPFEDSKYPFAPCLAEGVTAKKQLRIGWFTNDGFAAPTPACARAVEVTKKALRSRGHVLVPFDFNGPESITLFASLIGADQGKTLIGNNLKDEAIDPILKVLVFLISIPRPLRWLLATLNRFLGYSRIANLVGAAGDKSTTEVWALNARKKELTNSTISAWRALNLDAVICPAMVFPSPPIGIGAKVSMMCCYTAHWNVLDFPAGVVPVGAVTEEDETALSSYPIKDPWDKDVVSAARGGVGLPISVQVAALPWEDEICLRVMKEIELSVGCSLSGGAAQDKPL